MEAQVTVRIPIELREALDTAARTMQRKPSEIVRMALQAFLKGTAARTGERVEGLLGSIESGVPTLAERHRAYILESLKNGR